MARNFWSVCSPSAVALVAATPKTVLQIIAPSSQIVVVQKIAVSFDGSSPTAVPIQVNVVRQTTAGTMSSVTPNKTKDRSTALRVTATRDASAEPTPGDLLHTFFVHPQAGEKQFLDLPGEIELASATRLGLTITAPANVNALAEIEGEE